MAAHRTMMQGPAPAPGRWLRVALTAALASAIVVAIVLIVYPPTVPSSPSQPREPNMMPVKIAGQTFRLELALTDEARFRGLSDRKEIPARGGMLFVFPDSEVRVFVMRRCLVSIDIAFLDSQGVIVATHPMRVEPYETPEEQLHRYASGKPAQFAIELRGGTIAELGLQPGQTVELPLTDLKRRAR